MTEPVHPPSGQPPRGSSLSTLLSVLIYPPFFSDRWDTASSIQCSCAVLQLFLWAGEVKQTRSCTEPWGLWSCWWPESAQLQELTAGSTCVTCIAGVLLADRKVLQQVGGRMLVLDVLQFVQSVPSPLRDLARRRTADSGDGTTTS